MKHERLVVLNRIRKFYLHSSVTLIMIMLFSFALTACGESAPTTTLPPTTGITSTSIATTSTFTATTTSAAVKTTNPAMGLATVTPLPVATKAATTAPATMASTESITTDTTATTTVATTTSLATVAPTVALNSNGKLAYIESGNLFIYDLSNQTKKMLYQSTGVSGVVGTPSWSPDNSRLLITLRDDLKNMSSRSSLYLLKLTGEDPIRIKINSAALTSEETPVWSPDGKFIAFTEILDPGHSNTFNITNPREVWITDANGQSPRKIADGLEPSWSRDGTALTYVTNGGLKSGANFRENNSIHIVGIGTGSSEADREIISVAKVPADLNKYGIPFGSSISFLHTPVFLGSDKMLAFTAQGYTGLVITVSTSGSDMKIWDAQPEGGFGRVYTNSGKENMLMYEAFPASGISHVYILDTTTSPLPARVEKVGFGGEKFKESANNPAWSPDGTLVAYLYQTDGANVVGTSGIPGALAIATSQATKPQTLVKGVLTGLAWSH